MRTTVTIDDAMLARARELSGIDAVPALVRLALKRYVERESALQLAAMGGSQPGAMAPPRRRPPDFLNDEAEINDRPPIHGRRLGQAAE